MTAVLFYFIFCKAIFYSDIFSFVLFGGPIHGVIKLTCERLCMNGFVNTPANFNHEQSF